MLTDQATFAAGCFWGIEAAFLKLEGVTDAVSGYCGGDTPNPTYEQVCSGVTGHAEAVQVTYDPEKISYSELLQCFWRIHDPTTLNRQGFDIGSQYRSAIFYHNNDQLEQAKRSLAEHQLTLKNRVVTKIKELEHFYRAEEYHQRYHAKHGSC